MHQDDFHRDVARALGEPVSTIRRIGFVPVQPPASTNHPDDRSAAVGVSVSSRGDESSGAIRS